MNEKLTKILEHPATIPSASAVGGFIVGVGVGLLIARRNLTKHFTEIAADIEADTAEIERLTEELYTVTDEIPDDVTIVPVEDEHKYDGRDEAAITLNGESIDIPDSAEDDLGEIVNEVAVKPTLAQVFSDSGDTEWDYELEFNARDGEPIYILHRDEFFAEETGWSQTTLTWYDGDDVLCDERNEPVRKHEEVIGENIRFGHGSGDPNVVYIRNENIQAEYEVILDPGSYSIEVLGLNVEESYAEGDLKHMQTPRRMRPQD